MASYKTPSPGDEQADGLFQALTELANAPLPGARDLYVIAGLKPGGGFTATQENMLIEVSDALAETQRVFMMSGSVYLETRFQNGERHLVPLTEGGAVVPGAEYQLANLVVCSAAESGEFAVPKSFVDLLLRSEHLRDKLPEIKTYALRPVFDKDFVFRNPGWHSEAGILVHGPSVDPQSWQKPAAGLPAIERLPPKLRELLKGFCFKSDADLANFVGFLLTALLVSRYIETSKPIALVNGNQPGVGKSLLARVVGVLVDGADPPLVPFTPNEEELRKTIGAHLRAGNGSVIGLDNAKVAAGGKVDSAALESLVSGSELALRILGKSELVRRPNDLVWMLTMNDTKASEDLVRRGLPICLEFEGDPAARSFGGDPVKNAREHRVEILGELAGMIDYWTTMGRPEGVEHHRFKEWASEIGGIMFACGFPEFLKNMADAAAEFSAAADELTKLAEYVSAKDGEGLIHSPRSRKDKLLSTRDWVPKFVEAKVLEDELAGAKSEKAKAMVIGQFMARSVGKVIKVDLPKGSLTMTLRAKKQRANTKAYGFEINPPSKPAQDDQQPDLPPIPASAVGSAASTPEGNDEQW